MGSLIDINTDGLAKLGEVISFALGGTARGERKMAEAKAYSAELEARTKNKVALIEAQGQEALANYVAAKESRKLRNTMAVIEKAQSHFTEEEKVSDEPVDEGWKNRFFNIIEEVTDDDMREIWGRVLAGEVKRPKSYSLRTMEILRNLAKEEATLFVKASRFYIEQDFICTEDWALSMNERLLLNEIGFTNAEDLIKPWTVPSKGQLEVITDRQTLLILHNDTDAIINCNTNVRKLSKAGIEIMSLMTQEDRNPFYKLLTKHFKTKGNVNVTKHKYFPNEQKYITLGEEITI